MSHQEWSLIPVFLWLVFMGLLLEHPSSFSSGLVSPPLTNSFVQYQGRLSYRLCLSHILVIIRDPVCAADVSAEPKPNGSVLDFTDL